MQNSSGVRYLTGALLILLCSCAPLSEKPLRTDLTASELVQKVRDGGRASQSLRGLAKVAVESPERNFSASQVLIAQKPDRLRAETLSMFGQPVLFLATDGEWLRVSVPGQKRFYQGVANGQNLKRFVKVPLRVEDLVHLLLYQVPLLRSIEQRVVATDKGPRLELYTGDGQRQILDFDSDVRLVRCRLIRKAQVWLDVSYARFEPGDQFPRHLQLELPEYGTKLDIDFKQLELNPQLDPERFVLARPAGSALIELPGD